MTRAAELAQRWVREEIRALRAYHVADAGGLVKLDAMENPYSWPPELVEAWGATLQAVAVNRYPDPQSAGVKAALRERMGLGDGTGLLLGNGSDEIIQMLALAVAAPGRTLLAPEPSFVMYRMISAFTGLEYVGVPLRGDDFGLDLEAMRTRIEATQPAIVFLAVPNNPTGNCFPEADVRAVIEAAPGMVVIDEAYTAFSQGHLLHLAEEYPQVLVMRTLSKEGLAGLRLGILVGSEAWLGEIEKIRLPYNINVLTQAAVRFALAHGDVFEAQTAAIRAERSALADGLEKMPGVHTWPSEANFLLFRVPEGRAQAVFAGLKGAGVLVKCLDGSHPALRDCLRVTVGTAEENRCFLQALGTVLDES